MRDKAAFVSLFSSGHALRVTVARAAQFGLVAQLVRARA